MSVTLWASVLCLLGAQPGPSSLQALSDRAARVTLEAHPEPPLALFVTSQSPALGQAFATLLGAQLATAGLPAQVLPAGTEAEEAARAAGARALLRVAIDLKDGTLHARGDLLGTAENFWSGSNPVRPSAPATTLALTIPADEGARVLASQPPAPTVVGTPLRLERTSWARVEGAVAALAVGDADGDGKMEVLVLTERALLALSPEGKTLATHLLTGGRALTPPRLAFGAIAFLTGGGGGTRIAARLAQRDQSELLQLDARGGRWTSAGASAREPILTSAGKLLVRATLVPGQTAFQPVLQVGAQEPWTLPGPWTAATAAGADGPVLFALENGAVERRGAAGPVPQNLRSGAGLAWVDLEGDGRPELLVSSPEVEPTPEVLRVLSSPEGNPLAQWEVSGPVRHVSAGDLDGDGAEEGFAAVPRADGTTSIERIRRARP